MWQVIAAASPPTPACRKTWVGHKPSAWKPARISRFTVGRVASKIGGSRFFLPPRRIQLHICHSMEHLREVACPGRFPQKFPSYTPCPWWWTNSCYRRHEAASRIARFITAADRTHVCNRCCKSGWSCRVLHENVLLASLVLPSAQCSFFASE